MLAYTGMIQLIEPFGPLSTNCRETPSGIRTVGFSPRVRRVANLRGASVRRYGAIFRCIQPRYSHGIKASPTRKQTFSNDSGRHWPLPDYVPESDAASWTEQDLKIAAEQLVASNAEFRPFLRDALRPIRARLLGNLKRIFADPNATEWQRLSAANAFADYAASDVAKLSELLTVATPEQFAVLQPIVAASPAPATVERLGMIAATTPPSELGSKERVPFGQCRANAAVTLPRLGEREKVLPVFEMTDDPEALTQFIFRCRPRGVGVGPLLDCLRIVSDGPAQRYPRNTRYALLLALAEFRLEEIPDSRREPLLKEFADLYRNDPSSGVHGAAGWLLRQWGQAEVARRVDQTAVPYSPGREWFTLAISVTATAPPRTFHHTFVVFPAREYTIGLINDEPDRLKNEARHPAKLTRAFAALDREITLEELIAFSPRYTGFREGRHPPFISP